jgi:hypothetical protein
MRAHIATHILSDHVTPDACSFCGLHTCAPVLQSVWGKRGGRRIKSRSATGTATLCREQGIFFTELRHFHTFSTSFLAAHVKKWPWRPKIRHGFDMAGKGQHAFWPRITARTLLLVNLQPAQTGSAMSSCCQKRRAEARRWYSAHQNLRNGRSKFDIVLAKFDMSSTSKISTT